MKDPVCGMNVEPDVAETNVEDRQAHPGGRGGGPAHRRQARGRSVPAEKKETPLDILTARYAKGEISREVFVKMKKDLE